MFTFDEKKFFEPKPIEQTCPPLMSGHSFPEKVEYTSRMLRDTLERLQMFEKNMQDKYSDLMSIMTQDNVVFKELMQDAYSDFVSAVRSEINLFEANTDTVVTLFKKAVNARLDEHSKEYEAYKVELENMIADYENGIRAEADALVARVETAERYMKTHLNESVETLLSQMEADGSLVGVIDSKIMISAKQMGAVGDGVTDDSAAFQDAISECESTGKKLFVPAGEYLINTPLVLSKTIHIEGNDESSVVIKTNKDIPIFTINSESTSSAEWELRDTKFRSITLKGNGGEYGADSNGYGIRLGHEGTDKLYNVPFIVIENCRIEGFRKGVYLEGYGHSILNTYIRYCETGMELIHPEQVTINNSWIEYCALGFAVNNSKQYYGHNCQWYGGAIQRNKKGANIQNFYELFVNTYCENNSSYDFMLGDSADSSNYTKGVKNSTLNLNCAKSASDGAFAPVEVIASTNIKVNIACYDVAQTPHVSVGSYSKFVDVYALNDGGIPDDVTSYLNAKGDSAKTSRLFINGIMVRSSNGVLPKYSADVNASPFREDSIEYLSDANRYVESYHDSGKVIRLSNDSHSKIIVVNEATGGEILTISNNPSGEYKVITANIPVVLAGGVNIGGVVYSLWNDDGTAKLTAK